MQPEGGSFRDPGGAVFRVGERVIRSIHPRALEDWNGFSASPLFEELQREQLLIPTQPVASTESLPREVLAGSAAVVEHQRIPFVSYPYEWSFGMLKDAALLHLDLIERCLPHDLILKDSSAFNVQFRGGKPIFIDVLSFTRWEAGEPWLGYNQFCKMFLYPLMLEAYKHISFQSWLRSELEGLDPLVFSHLLSARDQLRPGVFTHVTLQAWMQKRLAKARTSVRQEIKRAGLSKSAIVNNIRGLRRLLHKLAPSGTDSVWADYAETHSYGQEALRQKEEFVRRAARAAPRRLVWDLGANVGRFSRLAAEHADYVVAADSDPATVEHLYRSLKAEDRQNILPLVLNLVNPSPDQGWAGRERQSLAARGKPDLVLCLALIHHMAISANIPIAAFLAWLAELGTAVVIEFVGKDDPRVQQLLLNKDDTYDDYNHSYFEACLGRFFRVEERLELAGGTRVLYYATPKAAAS